MRSSSILTGWRRRPRNGGSRDNIDRHFIAWGAAGWHICFDVLERFLGGEPIGRIVGPEAAKLEGWQRLRAEYAKLFEIEAR